MSGIVLSASVRQNLLSLQSTASLLATTQNDLATGNKVNSALDNPTSYFTAAALNNRASDISNLLDGIGNGVQVLQAANTGITSLQSLVASAQSVANQVLQTPIGYSTKSSVSSTAISGATANNLLGSTAATSGSVAAGAFTTLDVSGSTPATTAADITGNPVQSPVHFGSPGVQFTLDVDGVSQNISLTDSSVTDFTTAGGTLTGSGPTALSAQDVADIIDFQFNGSTTGAGPVSVNGGGDFQFASSASGSGSQVSISGLTGGVTGGLVGLGGTNNVSHIGVDAIPAAQNFTVAVDGGATKNISITQANVTAYNTAKGTSLSASSLSAANVASLINYQYDPTGVTKVASTVNGALVFTSGTTGTSSSVAVSAVSGTATSGTTGIGAASNIGSASAVPLSGKTLTIGATGGGTATSITFGTTGSDVSTLNQLNAQLATNNLQATIDPTGVLTITTSNNAASSTIGIVGGTSTLAGGVFAAFAGATGSGPVADPNAQATRAGLITQYNNILHQIDTTSQDSSFNGVNLLEGDTLNLTFDETGKSTLAISGVTFNTAGLGLSTLAAGTDFLDSNSANKVLASLNNVSTTLRSEASSLGSNLSIVQIRQDFSKNLINVLQTGASNLTLADTNEEAANSQALSTRQSIAVSALALANQSQQSVLQLLR